MSTASLARRDLPSPRKLANNVRALLHSATDDEATEGTAWYPSATAWCDERATSYGMPRETVAAVVAVLSPQMDWPRNLTLADMVLETHAIGGPSAVRALREYALPNSIERAARNLEDSTLADVKRSARTLKVHSFWRNLSGDVDAVTVDRHAVRVALAEPFLSLDNIGSDAAYRALAHAFRSAARAEGLAPCVVQAITWLVVRNIRSESTRPVAVAL